MICNYGLSRGFVRIARRQVMLIGIACGVVGSSAPLLAQAPPAPSAPSRDANKPPTDPTNPIPDVVIDPFKALPSDTGRMTHGDLSYATYRLPPQCYAAVDRLRRTTLRNTARRDTMPYGVRIRDTTRIPGNVLVAGRTCLANFDINAVDSGMLHHMLELGLLLGDTKVSDMAERRWLSLQPTVEDSGAVLTTIVRLSLSESHFDEWRARNALACLDSLGERARTARLRGHADMLVHAKAVFDIPAMRREASIVYALQMALETRKEYVELIGPEPEVVMWDDPSNAAAILGPHTHPFFRSSFIPPIALLGKSALPVKPTLVFGGELPPQLGRNGRVTLVGKWNLEVGMPAPAVGAMLRRLYQKYHDAGLDIVVYQVTEGYSGWTVGRPQTPEQEAAALKWLFLDHLKFPATLAVETTQYTFAPDGRRRNQPTSYQQAYVELYNFLIDREGKIACVGLMGGHMNEAKIEACVQRALGDEKNPTVAR